MTTTTNERLALSTNCNSKESLLSTNELPRRRRPRSLRLGLVSILTASALVAGGCAGDGTTSQVPPTSRCTPSPAQANLVASYREVLSELPEVGSPVQTSEYTADCTTQWPRPFHGIDPPPIRFAAVQSNSTVGQPLTFADLKRTIGSKANGWVLAGGWDDILGDKSAYANYCAEIDGVWSAMGIYRGPEVGGKSPLQIAMEGYPQARACPLHKGDG